MLNIKYTVKGKYPNNKHMLTLLFEDKEVTLKQAMKLINSDDDINHHKFFNVYCKQCLKILLFARRTEYNKLTNTYDKLKFLHDNCVGIKKHVEVNSDTIYYCKG